MTNDLQRRVAEGPLTTFQLVAIGVCVCLNMLDGFDILAMSFAASGVKIDWHLGDSQLGYLFSAGLVGMGIGSLTVTRGVGPKRLGRGRGRALRRWQTRIANQSVGRRSAGRA